MHMFFKAPAPGGLPLLLKGILCFLYSLGVMKVFEGGIGGSVHDVGSYVTTAETYGR